VQALGNAGEEGSAACLRGEQGVGPGFDDEPRRLPPGLDGADGPPDRDNEVDERTRLKPELAPRRSCSRDGDAGAAPLPPST